MHDQLTLSLESGEQLELGGDALVVFLDETGHEEYADRNYPLFGVGGCVIQVGDYYNQIVEPWRQIKVEHLGDPNKPLHAADLGSLRSTIAPAIGTFFHESPFGRIGVFSTDQTTVSENSPTPWLVVGRVMHYVGGIVRALQIRPPQVCIILESSERLEHTLAFYLAGYRLRVPDGTYDVKPHIFVLGKTALEPGLEVADFILHAGGGNVRAWLRAGSNPQRLDFKAVFEPERISHEYVKYMELLSASG